MFTIPCNLFKYKIQDRLYIAVLLYKIVLMGTVNFYIYLFFYLQMSQ